MDGDYEQSSIDVFTRRIGRVVGGSRVMSLSGVLVPATYVPFRCDYIEQRYSVWFHIGEP